ncbi:MAG TPA: carbonic anhydrase [Deltaproteobacteria bacterium]|nr:MAG: hypothetical protein A2048_05650 [Deltaproteobacteria bacterium GWA2_45_12]HBF13980.1 carbonic anhydrase [Deltaproteobacteria bacterium]
MELSSQTEREPLLSPRSRYAGTPIEELLLFHNEGKDASGICERPQLIVSLCMDQRISLHLPEGFAYTLRTPGSRIQGLEFAVSYAIAMGEVRTLAIIGHTDCAMTKVKEVKRCFVRRLDTWHTGWSAKDALRHFNRWAPTFYIENIEQHVRIQADWISGIFPDLLVAPMIYQVEDHHLYLLEENGSSL